MMFKIIFGSGCQLPMALDNQKDDTAQAILDRALAQRLDELIEQLQLSLQA